MPFTCSYRKRSGEVCKQESESPRCAKHTNKRTHVLCVNCNARWTSSYLTVCNTDYCVNVREARRSVYKRQRSHYNAEFAEKCVKMLDANDADMAP
jgi:hypothetical protein